LRWIKISTLLKRVEPVRYTFIFAKYIHKSMMTFYQLQKLSTMQLGFRIITNQVRAVTFTKLSCNLTKHHTMKMYWESGGVAPPICNIGTTWKGVVSFTIRSLQPPGK
jgi:hypothetical protein